MKLTAILFMFIAIFSCNSGNNNVRSDLQQANLKGKVQQIDKRIHYATSRIACPAAERNECNQSSYIYGENGNLVVSSEIDDKGNIAVVSKYIYNRRGICKEIDRYSGEKLTAREVSLLKGTRLTDIKIYRRGKKS